jgi:hypothetical protein
VAQLLILSPAANDDVLPALSLLTHRTRVIPLRLSSWSERPIPISFPRRTHEPRRREGHSRRSSARPACSFPSSSSSPRGGLTAVTPDWGVDDVVLDSRPAEVDTAHPPALGRSQSSQPSERIQTSGVVIDEASYSAKVHGRTLDPHLQGVRAAPLPRAHPSRVFTREQLLSEVWGYDYFGGTRTVDVHVRALRAKLGDLDSLIGTVRNVGYRFNVHEEDDRARRPSPHVNAAPHPPTAPEVA